MNVYDLRAKELRSEQVDRFKKSEDEDHFFTDFERGIAASIMTYWDLSKLDQMTSVN